MELAIVVFSGHDNNVNIINDIDDNLIGLCDIMSMCEGVCVCVCVNTCMYICYDIIFIKIYFGWGNK